jgi:outer membrane protein assembly factor BamB
MNQQLRITAIVLGLLACLAINVSAAEHWPKWRGPEGTGVAPQGNPPTTWSENQNVKWKVPVPGQGTSSPVIWENKLLFLTAVDTGKQGKAAPTPAPAQENAGGRRGGRGRGRGRPPTTIHQFDLVCLDRTTGKLLWQKTATETVPHEGHHPDHGFASYSPITDGKLIWASFGSRGLYCFDLDGNLKWSRDLIPMKTAAGFGEGSSPALAGDAVIVVCDHEGDSAIFAFNKETGQPLWRQDRDEGTSWATPAPVELDGKIQVVTSATNFVRSYDVKTGQVIWQCSGQTRNVIPSPVLGFGKVFCTSGFRGSALLAIELGHTGDLTDSKAVAWQVNEGTPYVPSPLLYDDSIYVCSGNNPILSHYDAQTGKAHFVQQRLSDEIKGVYASPVGAAGRVYVVGRNGVTVVIKDSETFDVLATNTLDDGFDASPAIVGDEIYLKGRTSLYCIAEAG